MDAYRKLYKIQLILGSVLKSFWEYLCSMLLMMGKKMNQTIPLFSNLT